MSSAESVGVGAEAVSVVFGAVESEEGVGAGSEMRRREVSSRSWASRESVRPVEVVERERVRLKRCWKARRSCFRFAAREELEERMLLA